MKRSWMFVVGLATLLIGSGALALLRAGQIPGEGENAAFDSPAQLAWRQFVFVNAPQGAGGSGAPVLWETWASAEEVFSDPNSTPVWPDSPRSGGSEAELVQQALMRSLARVGNETEDLRRVGALESDSAEDAAEVRYDRTAFDWIVLKQLWYLEGQQKWFDLHAMNQPVDVEFPDGATLIKASWKTIPEAGKSRFHWRLEHGRLWGLTALHVTTKILPGWFWATFEQVENPGFTIVAHPDPFGLDGGEPSRALLELMSSAGLDESVWRNYRLVGTQTEYTDRDGAPVVLGNSVIEAGFTASSSCRTCHVRATIGEAGRRLSFEPLIGSPDPAWFVSPSHPSAKRYLRLDYAWSLARAKRRVESTSVSAQ